MGLTKPFSLSTKPTTYFPSSSPFLSLLPFNISLSTNSITHFLYLFECSASYSLSYNPNYLCIDFPNFSPDPLISSIFPALSVKLKFGYLYELFYIIFSVIYYLLAFRNIKIIPMYYWYDYSFSIVLLLSIGDIYNILL
ncbi:hypothetical protein AMTRI_Chr04g186990 [Amborella trichopoda]